MYKHRATRLWAGRRASKDAGTRQSLLGSLGISVNLALPLQRSLPTTMRAKSEPKPTTPGFVAPSCQPGRCHRYGAAALACVFLGISSALFQLRNDSYSCAVSSGIFLALGL